MCGGGRLCLGPGALVSVFGGVGVASFSYVIVFEYQNPMHTIKMYLFH